MFFLEGREHLIEVAQVGLAATVAVLSPNASSFSLAERTSAPGLVASVCAVAAFGEARVLQLCFDLFL
jgi:hypothetical protein